MKNILSLVVVILTSSCKPYKVNFDNTILTEFQEERIMMSAQPYALCVIFEDSMIDDKIVIQDFNSKEVFLNETLKESKTVGISKIVFIPNNPQNYILLINNDLHYIESQIYDKYRYLVIYKPKRKNKKYILQYTNSVSYTDLFDKAKA